MKKIVRLTGAIVSIAMLFFFFSELSFSHPLEDPESLVYPQLAFSPPKAERVQCKNGMILYLIEDHELPLITIHSVARTGSAYDPPGLELSLIHI